MLDLMQRLTTAGVVGGDLPRPIYTLPAPLPVRSPAPSPPLPPPLPPCGKKTAATRIVMEASLNSIMIVILIMKVLSKSVCLGNYEMIACLVN